MIHRRDAVVGVAARAQVRADVLVANAAAVGAACGLDRTRGREERGAATLRKPDEDLVPTLDIDWPAADDAARYLSNGLFVDADSVWHGRPC